MTTNFKSFSRQKWSEMREGTPFQPPPIDTGPHNSSFYGINGDENINYDALADFIFENIRNSTSVFNWKDYARKPEKSWQNERGMDELVTEPNNINFSYQNDNNESISTLVRGKINKRVDYLEDYWLYYFNIDGEKKIIEATIKILFDNTKQFMVEASETINENDYRIDEKYVAINLTANDLNDFCGLIKDTVGQKYLPHVKELIAKKYCKKIKECKSPAALNFLYKNAPEYAIDMLHEYIDNGTLYNHIIILSGIDDNGILSFTTDSSGAVINCLKAIGDGKFLFDKFNEDHSLIKRIFENLDGYSEFYGEIMSNKLIFSTLLNALGNLYSKDKKVKGNLKMGGGFKIGANAVFEDDKEEDENKFFLNQEKENSQPIMLPGHTVSSIEYDTDENTGAYYSPFDFVEITEINGNEETPTKICAILAKAISHEEEKVEILKAVRIGLDIMAIIIGIASFGAGAGIAIALVDIGLASGDILVALNEDDLMKTKEGRAFLEAWNAILITGGVALAGPILLRTVYKNGLRLLKTATNPKTIEVLEISLKYIIKEIQNIPKIVDNSIEILTNFRKNFGASIITNHLENLLESGIILLKVLPEGNSEKQFILLYGDKILSFGDFKILFDDITRLIKMNGATLLEKLKAFLLLLKKEKTLVNTSAKIGEEASVESIKWGTVKMMLHPRFEEMVQLLNKRRIKIIEIEDVTEQVGYCERMIYDSKGTLLRIEKELEWHPEMRFLDLEHEIDHIIQFEKNLQGKFCTELKIERRPNVFVNATNAKQGYTSGLQKAFLEYEERIREIYRLEQRNVPKSIIDEHLDGLRKIYKEYESLYPKNHFDRIKFENWRKEYFPDFIEFNF